MTSGLSDSGSTYPPHDIGHLAENRTSPLFLAPRMAERAVKKAHSAGGGGLHAVTSAVRSLMAWPWDIILSICVFCDVYSETTQKTPES